MKDEFVAYRTFAQVSAAEILEHAILRRGSPPCREKALVGVWDEATGEELGGPAKREPPGALLERIRLAIDCCMGCPVFRECDILRQTDTQLVGVMAGRYRGVGEGKVNAFLEAPRGQPVGGNPGGRARAHASGGSAVPRPASREGAREGQKVGDPLLPLQR